MCYALNMTNTLQKIYDILDSIQPDEYGCHIYPSKTPPNFYRRVKIQGKEFRLNRIALERKLGRPIRPGYEALHTCDWPSCVNTEHLYEGTKQDNVHDLMIRDPTRRSEDAKKMWSRGRIKRKKD
jgi:hypothetical protein